MRSGSRNEGIIRQRFLSSLLRVQLPDARRACYIAFAIKQYHSVRVERESHLGRDCLTQYHVDDQWDNAQRNRNGSNDGLSQKPTVASRRV